VFSDRELTEFLTAEEVVGVVMNEEADTKDAAVSDVNDEVVLPMEGMTSENTVLIETGSFCTCKTLLADVLLMLGEDKDCCDIDVKLNTSALRVPNISPASLGIGLFVNPFVIFETSTASPDPLITDLPTLDTILEDPEIVSREFSANKTILFSEQTVTIDLSKKFDAGTEGTLGCVMSAII